MIELEGQTTDSDAVFIPPWAVAHVADAESANDLVKAGVARKARTARGWFRAYHTEKRWRTATSHGHNFTPPASTELKSVGERFVENRQKWSQWIADRKKDSPIITAVIYGDVHAPDFDTAAVNLFGEVANIWMEGEENPLFVDNGDTFDFESLSRWENMPRDWAATHPDEVYYHDPLTLTWSFYTAFHNQIIVPAAPNAFRVGLSGNHDVRFWKQADEDTAHNLLNKLDDMGIVFLGAGVNRLMIGDGFRVLHGTRARKAEGASIRATIENSAFGIPVEAQGHVHRVNTHYRSMIDGTVTTAFEIGSLQNRAPIWSNELQNWQQGCLLARINLNDSTDNEFHNILFQRVKVGNTYYYQADIPYAERIRVEIPDAQIAREESRLGRLH